MGKAHLNDIKISFIWSMVSSCFSQFFFSSLGNHTYFECIIFNKLNLLALPFLFLDSMFHV
uniref:Uncharacterized protein n=1 Tax=Rhizophora mucronata TaxID=61149 RepID=A0A2P2QNU1_RHIMU